MTTKYVTQSNQQEGTIYSTPITIMQSAATAGYTIDLPPGTYAVSMTINASVTGTGTTIGTIRPYANAAQTRVTNQDLTVVRPSDASLATKSISFPAAGVGKIVHLTGDANLAPVRWLTLPHGFRMVVTKGSAVTGEQFEAIVLATKLG